MIPAWIHDSLSREQRKPLDSDARHLVLIASAGAGKTRTLVHMLVRDLLAGIPPEQIVAFTFMDKSAAELLVRVHQLCRVHASEMNLRDLYIGTFHTWCLTQLKRQPEFSGWDALDNIGMRALIARMQPQLGLNELYGLPGKDARKRFAEDVQIVYNEHLPLELIPEHLRGAVAAYLQATTALHVLPFGGMIRDAVDVASHAAARQPLSRIYIDEYQDIDGAQVELVKALAQNGARVIAVGDPLQNIYNWRGSDITRIQNFADDFAAPQVMHLTENHRSRPAIIDVANAAAALYEADRTTSPMVARREPIDTTTVNWVSTGSIDEHIQAIATILRRFHNNGVPWQSMAILLRTVRESGPAAEIIEGLTAAGIPTDCTYARRDPQFIPAFILQIVDALRAPSTTPDQTSAVPFDMRKAKTLWNVNHNTRFSRTSEAAVLAAFDHWGRKIEAEQSSAFALVDNLLAFLDACDIRLREDDHELSVSLAITTRILRAVEDTHRSRIPGTSSRNAHELLDAASEALIELQGEYGEHVPVIAHQQGVLITTMHQAKGREWPVVILPALNAKAFQPWGNRPDGSFPDHILERYQSTTASELRLFYVALTRAEERLFLLDHAGGDAAQRAEFLNELEQRGLLKPTTLGELDDDVWQIPPDLLEPPIVAHRREGLTNLLDYLDCPYRYGLTQRVGVQRSIPIGVGVGRAVHEIIKRRIEWGQAWTADELDAEVDDAVHLPLVSEDTEAGFKQRIASWMNSLETQRLFNRNTMAEVPITVVRDGGVIDCIVDSAHEHDGGLFTVVDWKSNVHPESVGRYQRQIQFYAHALRTIGATVADGMIVDIGATARIGQLVAYAVDISSEATDDLVAELDAALEGIAQYRFHPTPSKTICAGCSMRSICGERWDGDPRVGY